VPVKQGEILWVRTTDPQGANEKCRPFVVLTLSRKIARGETIVAAAITTTLPDPLPDEYVELPWHPKGTVHTGLKKRCAVCCRLSRSIFNTPERVRTSNLRFRRPMLYPIELRVRVASHLADSMILTNRNRGGKSARIGTSS
jgi:PemK-like, MazF-like toxin of type II toxin-antitoxin system